MNFSLPWSPDTYGGFGGHDYFDTQPGRTRTPVVFIHGNRRDAHDWLIGAQYLRSQGYRGDDLWAISFANRSPTHEEMARQLDDFIQHVYRESRSERIQIVAHSLGVTGARYWMDQRSTPERVDTFISLAGANHGLTISEWACRFNIDAGIHRPSEFLRADYETIEGHPLKQLNDEETPEPTEWYTLYGRHDPLFALDPESPRLRGAHNVCMDGGHDDVRTTGTALSLIHHWLSTE